MDDATGHEAGQDQRMSARTATLAWVALVSATVLGWFFARSTTGSYAQESVVVLAGIKIYLIMAVFMGLWRAPKGWHLAAIAWVVATCAIVFYLFSLGGA